MALHNCVRIFLKILHICVYTHTHIYIYLELHTYIYKITYIHIYVTTYTHTFYSFCLSGKPWIIQPLTSLFSCPLVSCQCLSNAAKLGESEPWTLPIEVSILGHRVERIWRGKSRLAVSNVYFPTERHFEKSGGAVNGLRPFTGSASLIQQSWSSWPTQPAAFLLSCSLSSSFLTRLLLCLSCTVHFVFPW